MYSFTLSLTSALDGVGSRRHVLAALPPGKQTRYPLYWRLGGPQGRVWKNAKNLPPPAPRNWNSISRQTGLYRVAIPTELHRPIVAAHSEVISLLLILRLARILCSTGSCNTHNAHSQHYSVLLQVEKDSFLPFTSCIYHQSVIVTSISRVCKPC